MKNHSEASFYIWWYSLLKSLASMLRTPVLLAFIGVVLIWSTTPLAIQFSQSDIHYFVSLVIRIGFSGLILGIMLLILRQPFRMDRQAWHSYLAGALGTAIAMYWVYWGALALPSGLISVIYGLSPILTGCLAWWWLGEKSLSWVRVISLITALVGVGLVVKGRLTVSDTSEAFKGLTGTLLSVCFFVISSVWVKKVNAKVAPIPQTFGSLLVSLFIYIPIGWYLDLDIPSHINSLLNMSTITFSALLYLSLAGSVVGFLLYFYILERLPASNVTLVTLIAPVLAVLWGTAFNNEVLAVSSAMGAAVLLISLAAYQWHDKLR